MRAFETIATHERTNMALVMRIQHDALKAALGATGMSPGLRQQVKAAIKQGAQALGIED